MKIWVGTSNGSNFRRIYSRKPVRWAETIWFSKMGGTTFVCPKVIDRLLRGTGLRLPRHGTDELVEVEITAKKPRRKK